MNPGENVATFAIVAFSLAIVIILKKDTIPAPLKRPLAITSLVMVATAFILLVYSFIRVE